MINKINIPEKPEEDPKLELQLEPERGGGFGPPRRPTAVGLGGSSDRNPYKAGQHLACTVLRAVPGGYQVIIKKDGRKGFFETREQFKTGCEILAKFVYMHKDRILLSFIRDELTLHNMEEFTPFKAGYWLACTVLKTEPSGYSVAIKNSNIPGLLETTKSFAAGVELTAKFVRMHQGRAILKIDGKINPWNVTAYKAGQNVVCTVKGAEQGGYEVVIKKDNLPGFIKSIEQLKPGSEILAKFVCVHKDRVLLSPIFQENRGGPGQAASGNVTWQEHNLNELDQAYQQKSQNMRAYRGIDEANLHQPVESSAAPEQTPDEQQPDNPFPCRRAVDLLMPPSDEDCLNSLKTFHISEYGLDSLITDVEGGMRTGVLKTTSPSKCSRSAMLLYMGRLVGCIYGSKTNPDAKASEASAFLALRDLEESDTMVTIYDLPREVVLALSALFLGYTLEREGNIDNRTYFNSVMNNFVQNQSTACFVVSIPSPKSTCLIFVGKGKFGGAFFVEEQQFTKDPDAIYKLLNCKPTAQIEVSLLSPEAVAPGMRFGYSLTMLRKRPPGSETL